MRAASWRMQEIGEVSGGEVEVENRDLAVFRARSDRALGLGPSDWPSPGLYNQIINLTILSTRITWYNIKDETQTRPRNSLGTSKLILQAASLLDLHPADARHETSNIS